MKINDIITEQDKKHTSPSGVETNMKPSDDDYAINYGKNGGVAKFRKSQGLDVKTGEKKIKEDPKDPNLVKAYRMGNAAFKTGNKDALKTIPQEYKYMWVKGWEDGERFAKEESDNRSVKENQIPKGYSYEPREEDDDDVSKIQHYLRTPDNKLISIPFTPYNEMSDRDVALWIKLGMPRRKGGNWDSQSLEQLSKIQGE